MSEVNRLKLLTVVMRADFAVLGLLGAGMMLAPGGMLAAFEFGELPRGVHFMLSMWGALMATMGVGYLIASRHPAGAQSWVIAGFFRAALEVAMCIVYMSSGAVSLRSAGPGLFLALWFAIFYAILYPRKSSAPSMATGAA